MVDQTINDAAERVERLPVTDVFDWRRLRSYAIRVLSLALGLYLLVGAAYCVWFRSSAQEFAYRFNNIAGIWCERNILLANTIWPRQAHLELVGFPDTGDLRVGRDVQPPPLRVRAWKWVISDRHAPEGWRPLQWSDLTPDVLGAPVPAIHLPADWHAPTLDQIELRLDKPENQKMLDADTVLALRDVFAQLDERAGSARMGRRLRKLHIPEKVTVYYRGDTIRSEQTLKKQAGNEYAGVLSDLKESVRFTVNGEDYYTPYKKITLVPPPTLVVLTRDEEQPAYLWQRPPVGADLKFLKGKKQEFIDVPVSLSGMASHIDVPVGTNVVLKGKTDKELRPQPDGIHMRPREGTSLPPTIIQQADDLQSFEVRFNNVKTAIEFEFDFIDTDNVHGRRAIIIKPLEDAPPDIDAQVEVIRKTNDGYMVTPVAHVPFSGKVRDDHGLETLEYASTVQSLDAQGLHASPVVSLLQFSPAGSDILAAPVYLSWVNRLMKRIAEDTDRPPERAGLTTFARRMRESAAQDVPAAGWEELLHKKPERVLLRDHSIDPDEEFFDVEKLRLKVTDDRQPQTRYRMRLWLIASDNNIETGPGISESKERFTFVVVSENELLTEIAKEEEGLHLKLEKTVNDLKDARAKLDQVSQELPGLRPGNKQEFSPMALRLEEVIETLTKGWDITREVYIDYRRILKEEQVNRVHPKIIEKVELSICEPLDGAINQEFVRSDESLRAFHKTLEALKADKPAETLAKQQLDQLIDRLTRVLDAMGDITTINKLIEQLVELERQERKASERFGKLVAEFQEKLLNDALGSPSTPDRK
jgi:hypothetical protein